MPKAVKPIVAALLRGGLGPNKVLEQLRKTYKDRPRFIASLPSRDQIKAHQAWLKKSLSESYRVNTYAALLEWAATRTYKGKSDIFYGESW
ncbi:hypothetical protein SDRG_05845 [Saprolegnia diclina VS20]|uniref:Uncharacterized protein n=1 Tax=Saprolegnia diclina (strain VS20) TaxID=1156394 RepID=T0QQM3_SAPDV|nr:hypothetical protein SDRG_05845 [Saprolegnia diclina VS20]EQC37026.1 hypothetical protein SDRG_05845 [Saprolegnia diclina VS20]|eukprot:XP_008609807.1 hypothetical protein SDRG_05845 [Saprolegnia diclina VS20]